MHETDAIVPNACMDHELLALFLEGKLAGDARARAIRHLAACERCREAVALVNDAVGVAGGYKEDPPPPRRFRWDRTAVVALALAASLLIAVGTYQGLPWWRPSPYRELIAAAGASRPVDGRLSGFPYATASVTRGFASAPTAGNYGLLAAAARVKSAAAKDPSAANLHALGVAQLVLGEFDEAVRTLEDAAGKAPGGALVQSDLSAALAARGRRQETSSDFARSLAAADRALTADPRLPEAYFNRALALEALSLDAEARAAWRAYLLRDPEGPWASEAREHLARQAGAALLPFSSVQPRLDAALAAGDAGIVAAILDTYPLASREYLSDELLPTWASAVLAGDGDAAALLAPARRLIDALAGRGDDRAPRAMLAPIEAAAASPDRLRRLASLHRTYAEGKRLQRADRTADAAAVFATCAATDATSHPLELDCAYQSTATALNSGHSEASRARLLRVNAVAQKAGYASLAGLSWWRLALFSANSGDLTAALADYQRALDGFTTAGVNDLAANVHSLMSEMLRILGDSEGAWRQHRAALASSRTLWSPRVRHQILVQTVLTSLDSGLPEVALDVIDTLIAEDRAWQHQPSLALAYSHRARALARLERQADALDALDAAKRTIAAVPDPDYQRRFDTELLAARIDVLGAARPKDTLAAAQEGLDNVLHAESALRVPGFLFARGTARAALGDADQAEHDYVDALARLEAERDRLSPDSLRISHMERNFSIVRTLVAFELTTRRDPMRALAALEQSRARWLLAAVRGPAARPVTPDAVLGAMPADTAVVYYGVLDGKVHAWVLTDRGMTYRRLATTAGDLDASARALWARLESGGAGEREQLVDLDDRLIAPLREAIGSRRRLVVVPDGPIYNVPFAALIDRASGRYLVERATVAIGPSLTLAPIRLGAAAEMAGMPSVGIFGGNVAGEPLLREVDTEQRAIADIYSSPLSRRYRGDKQEFLVSLDRHDIVHFAGHATANLADPAFSRLQFPTADGLPTGDVLAGEIAALRLHRVRVVVLAACRTGWGPNAAGEGILSLAHAFLGAGAAAVLGSLWDVDDRGTRTLLTWMHEAMAHGQSLADALRTAQLRALSSTDPDLRRPSRWAAFVASVRS